MVLIYRKCIISNFLINIAFTAETYTIYRRTLSAQEVLLYKVSYIYKIEEGLNPPNDADSDWLRVETNVFTGDFGSFRALPYRSM